MLFECVLLCDDDEMMMMLLDVVLVCDVGVCVVCVFVGWLCLLFIYLFI